MNYKITPIERMVLESLQKRKKTKLELLKCTQIPAKVINHVIMELLSYGIIVQEEQFLSISTHLTSDMIKRVQCPTNSKIEAMELISSCIDDTPRDDVDFKLKKVSLSKSEKIILNGLLKQIELFFESIKENNSNPTSEQELIFWGKANYGKIINNYING